MIQNSFIFCYILLFTPVIILKNDSYLHFYFLHFTRLKTFNTTDTENITDTEKNNSNTVETGDKLNKSESRTICKEETSMQPSDF